MLRRKDRLLMLLPLLLVTLLVGCSKPAGSPAPGGESSSDKKPAASKAGAGPSDSATSPAVQFPQRYEDDKTGLTIGVPEGWVATPYQEALVALISPQNGEEDFFLENLLITADDQFKDLTLASYLKALAAEVRKRYPDTQTLESGEVEVAGIAGHWMVDSFTGSKGATQVYRVVLVNGPVAYVLHGTAPVQSFERYRPIFEAMAQSVTWESPAAKP